MAAPGSPRAAGAAAPGAGRPAPAPGDAVRLIGAVSHEMRNPLNGILGMAHLLGDTPLDAAQRSHLDAIRQSGEVLLTLVNDLLDLTALQSGAVAIRRAPASVEALVNQTLELAAPAAHGKGLGLGSVVDPALAAPVTLDAGRVRQVLTNLVSNAIKFTHAGGVRVDARRQDGPDGAWLVIEVRDTGEGIAEADRALVFEPFGRTATARVSGTEGTGLGLPLSRGLAEAMGGSLALAASARGAGSTLRLAVPLDPDDGPAPAAPPPLAGQRVLIAMAAGPDGATTPEAAALGDTLAGLGAQVRHVGEAQALNGPPHAIDHVLVDARFDHAMLWARLCLPGTGVRPVVLMRADERGQLGDLRAAGFGGYLVRPVRRASLEAMLTDRIAQEAAGGFRTDPADTGALPVAPARPRRVLVADDSAVNALLVRSALERLGHTVMTVNDGARAIALAQDGAGSPFDLVLLDLSMPVLDGFAAARQIRARGFTGRIVALSGNTDPDLDAKLARAGFDGFAQKPITPVALARLVEG